jgi:predicted enzyme related to lactoylglutathione lyase
MKPATLLGLRTAVYYVTDLGRAKDWYESALGISPYFDEPFYVGFNVGGFEFGLHPAEPGSPSGRGGAVPYWGVENLDAAWKRLLGLGGKPHSEPQDVGEGIRVAAVGDPFGNLLGLIENPHFPNTA